VVSALARQQLMPTGRLRVGLNSANLLTRAIGAAMGRDLATRLGTEVLLVEYATPGAVANGVATDWDIAFLAADAERETTIAFTRPYVELDATYLVRGESPIHAVADADRAGISIATPPTAAYTLVLKREVRRATLVFLADDQALQQLEMGDVHAIAGLRDTLLRRVARVPGGRVLDDTIARARQAIAVPKANGAALHYLTDYLAEIKTAGLVDAAIQATGFVGASTRCVSRDDG
jgi:polar amino acid transport system substrate-binding protein